MSCCYGPRGCCNYQGYYDRAGSVKRTANTAIKGDLQFDEILQWDRKIFSSDAVRKFHVDHPILCIPLSIVRFTLRTVTAPIISLISVIVLPIIALISKNPNKYLGAFGWAVWKTIILTAIICICAFAISQSNLIIFLGIYGGMGVLGEIIHCFSVREHGRFDENHDFPLQQTMNESRSGLLALIGRYLFA